MCSGGGRSTEQRRSRLVVLLTALVVALGLALALPTGALADDDDTSDSSGTTTVNWQHSKSKTATNLALDEEGNLYSDVTITFPSDEEELTTDLVFVLDTSDCYTNTMEQMKTLVSQLKEATAEQSDHIRIGIVVFKGSAAYIIDEDGNKLMDVDTALGKFDELYALGSDSNVRAYASDPTKAEAYGGEFITSGSNLHSGLMAAKELLDGDTEVAASRKYLLTVSDNLVYYWNDDAGNVYGVFDDDEKGTNSNQIEALFYTWCGIHNIGIGNYSLGSDFDWDSYLATARQHIANDIAGGDIYKTNIRELAQKTGRNWSGVRFFSKVGGAYSTDPTQSALNTEFLANGYHYVTTDDLSNHALGIDRAVVASLDTYQDLVDEHYRCYAFTTNYGQGTLPDLLTSEFNSIAKVPNVSSIADMGIADSILYLMGPGSEVDDTLGYVADDYDFDLVNGGQMVMTIETVDEEGESHVTTYQANVLYENCWGFRPVQVDDSGAVVYGTDGLAIDDPDSDIYAYVVTYTPGEADAEQLTWTTNVRMSNFEKVSLTYSVQLAKPKSEPGTYGGYNRDGSLNEDGFEKYTSLYTNNSAVLTPKNSLGQTLDTEEFNKPTVSYVVVGVDKSWSDGADAHTGDSVLVGVTDSGLDGYAGYIYVTAGSNWYGSVALPLPVGAYGVEEVETSATGYTATYGGSLEDGFTVTNTATDSGDNGSGTGDSGGGSGTSTTTTTTKAGRTLPFTGDPATLAGVLATLAAGSGALAVGVRRRGRR